jgi:hypothetical protein
MRLRRARFSVRGMMLVMALIGVLMSVIVGVRAQRARQHLLVLTNPERWALVAFGVGRPGQRLGVAYGRELASGSRKRFLA